MPSSAICTGTAGWADDLFMADDPLWTRLGLLQRATGVGPALRAVIYWDDTGLWSYRQLAPKPFTEALALGRALHAEQP